MLIIRREQRRVLQEQMRESFHQRMVMHLRNRYAVLLDDKTQAEVRSVVDSAIEEARALGIGIEADLQTYLECYVEFGPGFTENPDNAEIQGLFADERLNMREQLYELRRRRFTRKGS